MNRKQAFILLIFWALMALAVSAQKITGQVVDAVTGEEIPFATLVYRSHQKTFLADINGKFSIERHEGWQLFISALGYRDEKILVSKDTKKNITFHLRPTTQQIKEVVIDGTKGKYSRKNNPAVELMKRVVAAKKKTRLENNDFYEYYKYQKITLAKNNVTADDVANLKQKGNKEWLVDQVEVCDLNNKLILPMQISETVSRKVYRKDPKSEKTYILGQNSSGVANLVETAGNILDATMKDIFTDVDIYDDQVRLLQFPFTSPIGKDAVAFYRFYIVDTLMVGDDSCIHLQFTPNNQQDFGFNGDLYILNDSSLHVRKVELSIPKKSDVNFVESMKINQEYVKLPNGQWVLDTDDMLAEMRINRVLKDAVVIRSTKMSDYSFSDIPKSAFRGTAKIVTDADSRQRGNDFWKKFRTVQLTKAESKMDKFAESVSGIPGMKYGLFILRAFMNNFVSTSFNDSVRSKFDIGPINTIISKNIVDGYRFRLSGRTTAALNNHFFWKGYVAYGSSSSRWYYNTELTWSFNRKNNEPWEFPIRQLQFVTEYDIMSPSDKFLLTNKDNMFMAFRAKSIDKMYFYNRQQLQFKYETLAGLATTVGIKAEGIKGAAAMEFFNLDGTPHDGEVRTTELSVGFRYAPGETFINTKQRRYPINFDAPIFSLSHTMGVNGFLGSNYKMNYTEASIYKRFWLNSWGKIDAYVLAGAQWDKVPFPLLIMPRTNLSYFNPKLGEHNFQLVNNMEFLSDRFFMWDLSWDFNGKIFNRIPLLKKLKWREIVGFRGMFSKVTDKNNPFLAQNQGDGVLMKFPEGCNIMDGKVPYMEWMVGIHNIFKFLEIDYIQRVTYKSLPTSMVRGIRFAVNMTF